MADLVAEAVHAHLHNGPAEVDAAIGSLLGEWGSVRGIVATAIQQALERMVSGLWLGGWEPADVIRVVGRRLTGRHVRLVGDVMVAELTTYPPSSIEARWAAQLTEAEARAWWPGDLGYLQAWLQQGSPDVDQLLTDAIVLLGTLSGLPQLEALSARPGTAAPPVVTEGEAQRVDDRILGRVRALLAKAESTPYPAEAETFTAGAQALMARHSIDMALLAATSPGARHAPAGRRIGIDNPYESPKALLLQVVAEANRSRMVWSQDLGHATLVGFRSDLDAVETLFTSLLVQGTRAMTDAGSRTTVSGHSRTRAFRQSFLSAYAQRLGERLRETTQAQTARAATETGRADLLPVLAARDADVAAATTVLFPAVVSRSIRMGSDPEGWASGRSAADLAVLQADAPVQGPAPPAAEST